MCSERVSSSCSTSDTRCVNLVTNPVETHELGKGREVLTICMSCRSLFVLLLLAIVLSVPRFTDSEYTFGIFKLFLH
jgi:hypothetical protein